MNVTLHYEHSHTFAAASASLGIVVMPDVGCAQGGGSGGVAPAWLKAGPKVVTTTSGKPPRIRNKKAKAKAAALALATAVVQRHGEHGVQQARRGCWYQWRCCGGQDTVSARGDTDGCSARSSCI